jgi:Domain of unknown function (DUF4495)
LIHEGFLADSLLKVFRKGLDQIPMFRPRQVSPARWFVLVSPKLFPREAPVGDVHCLQDRTAVAVELSILRAQPEASWPLLVKVPLHFRIALFCLNLWVLLKNNQVLLMRNCLATQIVLRHLLRLDREQEDLGSCSHDGCGGFLCGRTAGCWVEGSRLTPNQVLAALVHVIIVIAGEPEGGGVRTLTTALAHLLHQVKFYKSSSLENVRGLTMESPFFILE